MSHFNAAYIARAGMAEASEESSNWTVPYEGTMFTRQFGYHVLVSVYTPNLRGAINTIAVTTIAVCKNNNS